MPLGDLGQIEAAGRACATWAMSTRAGGVRSGAQADADEWTGLAETRFTAFAAHLVGVYTTLTARVLVHDVKEDRGLVVRGLAAAGGGNPLSTHNTVEIAIFCAILLGLGVSHYRGCHKRYLRMLPGRSWETIWFGMAWYGAFGLLVVAIHLCSSVIPVLGVVLAVPAVPIFVIALMSIFWLPSRLLPGWYLRWRAHGRPSSELSL